MSIFHRYHLRGRVRDCDATKRVVDGLRTFVPEEFLFSDEIYALYTPSDEEEGVATVAVQIEAEMTHNDVGRFCDLVKRLDPYCLEAIRVTHEYENGDPWEDEIDEFFIGPTDAVQAAISKDLLGEIEERLGGLTEADRRLLRDMLDVD